ncbi:MAG: hypothetical protein EXQ52_04395 [Bryobacterales bacterium]|nr:hypothetical protein [Bryobacterales bacterium]
MYLAPRGGLTGLGLLAAICGSLCAQTVIVRLRAVEGEGAVHPAGSRSARPLTIEVTDETGQPVQGAAVSFRLPEEGPGGVFANGLGTDVVISDSNGHASVRGMRLNRSAGPFEIRVTASKDQARAGIVVRQFIASGPAGAAAKPGFSKKWVVVGLVAAGALGGILGGTRGGGGPVASPGPAQPPPVVLTIGAPTVTIGKP